MEIRKFNKQEMRQLLGEQGLSNGNVFVEHGKKIRLSHDFVDDFKKTKTAVRPSYGVDREQIEWLDSKRYKVQESKLPGGVVEYQGVDVGVIYPSYYLGFQTFENLSREDAILILKNLKKAIANNEELLQNGIFNEDFVLRNMMYLGTKVGLIGLDGKYIKREENSSFARVNEYFPSELNRLIDTHLRFQCRERASEYSRLICELREILAHTKGKDTMEYPRVLVEEVEKARILK